jgi:putative sigma-54 modulation protein
MNVEITSRHVELSDALRSYAAARIAEIERLGETFQKALVVFEQDHGRTACEIIVHPRRGDAIVAKDLAPDARAAVDAAMVKIEKQFLRAKEKRDDRRKGA